MTRYTVCMAHGGVKDPREGQICILCQRRLEKAAPALLEAAREALETLDSLAEEGEIDCYGLRSRLSAAIHLAEDRQIPVFEPVEVEIDDTVPWENGR